MTQEEFAQALEPLKQQLMEEVIPFYQEGNDTRGNQAFTRWKERFTFFLQSHAPDEAKRFIRSTTHMFWSTSSDQHPYHQFMQDDGATCIAFLDDLIDSARKERILNFQESAIVAPENGKATNDPDASRPYVDVTRLQELRDITSSSFDLTKLVRLCEELNLDFKNECYFSVGMLLRSIVDHVPPIFSCTTFKEVANNYSSGSRSFKELMQHLDISSRKIADAALHVQIRSQETLLNETQVNFSPDLDVLLSEVVRKLK